MKIWVFAESENSNPTTATLEMVTKARELGGTIEAVYVGTDADAVATGLGEYGVSKVHAVDPQGGLVGVVGAAAIAGLVASEAPDLILFAQTYDGRDAIARLSARLDRTVLTNGMSLAVDGDSVTVGTAVFGGTLLVDAKFTGEKPYLAAIRPKSFAAEPGGATTQPESVSETAKRVRSRIGPDYPRKLSFCRRNWANACALAQSRKGLVARSSAMVLGSVMRS